MRFTSARTRFAAQAESSMLESSHWNINSRRSRRRRTKAVKVLDVHRCEARKSRQTTRSSHLLPFPRTGQKDTKTKPLRPRPANSDACAVLVRLQLRETKREQLQRKEKPRTERAVESWHSNMHRRSQFDVCNISRRPTSSKKVDVGRLF